MNPEISKLFEILEIFKESHTVNWGFSQMAQDFALDTVKSKIKEISATLNPQIPEPYASMSRDEILGGIGRYDICNL